MAVMEVMADRPDRIYVCPVAIESADSVIGQRSFVRRSWIFALFHRRQTIKAPKYTAVGYTSRTRYSLVTYLTRICRAFASSLQGRAGATRE